MSVSLFGDANKRASNLFNSLPYKDRAGKVGLGYCLAQHTTIVQTRIKNKEAWQEEDRKLAVWQKNVEKSLEKCIREIETNQQPQGGDTNE